MISSYHHSKKCYSDCHEDLTSYRAIFISQAMNLTLLFLVGNRKDASKAADLVLLLAKAKAEAIIKSGRIPIEMNHEILLTADQIVLYDNTILEKPKDLVEARKFIEGYGILPCKTVGSIVLTDLQTNKQVEGVDICTIYFDPIPNEIIQKLLDEGKNIPLKFM